jgi:peptidase E
MVEQYFCYNLIMKLFLSSSGISAPLTLEGLIDKPLSLSKVLIVPNAKDDQAPDHRQAKITETINSFLSTGIKATCFDLNDFKSRSEMQEQLCDADVIWVMGGNPFLLRYKMQQSGFDRVIGSVLEQGVVYGSESGGSIVAGSSLDGFEYGDLTKDVPKIITSGLNLVPYVITPHENIDFFAGAIQSVRSRHAAEDIVSIKDGQVVVFDDLGMRIVEPEIPL